MSDAFTPDPADDPLRDVLDGHAAFEQRVTDYLASVDAMAGPLGELFRVIGHAYGRFLRDDQDGHTTPAEYERLQDVMDAALRARTWLQEDR
jgi:hypothetical protein